MKTKNLKLSVAYWMCWFLSLSSFFMSGVLFLSAIFLSFDSDLYNSVELVPLGVKYYFVEENMQGTPIADLQPWNFWWLFFQNIVGFAVLGLIFLFSRRIVHLVQRGKMFSSKQIKWFNGIGIGFLILAAITIFGPDFTEETRRATFSFNVKFIFAALFSFILAEIFQEGNRLNEESKLTV